MRSIRLLLIAMLLLPVQVPEASANGVPLAAFPRPAGGELRPAAQTGIAILHERLTLDLRQEPGRITALYSLQNQGRAREQVTVAFLVPEVPGITSPPAVRLNGAPLEAESPGEPVVGEGGELAPYWLDPFTGERYQPLGHGQGGAGPAWTFPLVLEAGEEAELEVSYRQTPGRDLSRFVAAAHRYDYLLQPARHWSAFGTLEVEVLMPAGRSLQSNIPLQRTGPNRYGASFEGLPEENLSLFLAPGGGSGLLGSWWWQRAVRPWLLLGLTFTLALAAGLAGRLTGPAWKPWLALLRWSIPLMAIGLSPAYMFAPSPLGLITLLVFYIPGLLLAFAVGGFLLPRLLMRGRASDR